jgi:hypothetical protein
VSVVDTVNIVGLPAGRNKRVFVGGPQAAFGVCLHALGSPPPPGRVRLRSESTAPGLGYKKPKTYFSLACKPYDMF